MPAFVQTLLGGATGGAVTSVTITGSKTVTLGNEILLLATHSATGSPTTAVDNLGNTYTLVHTYTGSPECAGLTNSRQDLWRAVVTAPGTLTSQTASWSLASGVGGAACSIEVSDGDPLVQNIASCSGGATSASITTGAVSGILLWTIAIVRGGGSVTGYTPASGFTNAWFVGASGAFLVGAAFDYKVGSASGTLTATWTESAEFTLRTPYSEGAQIFRPQIIRYNRTARA